MQKKGAWTKLSGRMKAGRGWFTPCVYEAAAYLCGGYVSSIDVFDLPAQEFRPNLTVELPEQFSGTVSFVRGQELVIISVNYTTHIDLKTHEVLAVKEHAEISIRSNSTPFITKDKVYWVRVDGQCVCAILQMPSVVEVISR